MAHRLEAGVVEPVKPDPAVRLLDAEGLPDEAAEASLRACGFQEPAAARRRILGLCPDARSRARLEGCFPTLMRAVSESASPDSSLLNFERYMQSVSDRVALYGYLSEHPRAVEILVKLFVGSQFLTEILLNHPDYLERLTQHRRLAEIKYREVLIEEALVASRDPRVTASRLDRVRQFQKWELLRLGACDTFGLMDLKTVTLQLALLADAIVQVCLSVVSEDAGVAADGFAVIAFGKLGGEELNYSSDIDLVFVSRTGAERFWGLGQKLIRALMDSTAHGFLYRVDMRLRPWGQSGPLVTNLDAYVDYLRRHGRLWEKQALLKARCIAGDHAVGEELLARLSPLIFETTHEQVCQSVLEMKSKIEAHLEQKGRQWGEVKAGQGSIRDVEFVTQALQLMHGGREPAVRSINTLDGLVRLANFHLIQADEYRRLSSGYAFLRTIEHALQLMHNKQMHSLPQDRRELAYLARRLDFPGPDAFVTHYEQHCREIRAIFEKYIVRGEDASHPAAGDLDREVYQHLGTAASSYRELFEGPQRERHMGLLDQLRREWPVRVDAQPSEGGRTEVTVAGYDQLGDLSVICGLLFAYGFDIEAGHAFTGADVPAGSGSDAGRERKFVNVFLVRHPSGVPPGELWVRYEADLAEYLMLLHERRHPEVQGRLAKRVANAMLEKLPSQTALMPVVISIDQEADPDATVLHIRGEDTPGFLYELTNALSLFGTSITRMQIQSVANQVVDTLHVTDPRGRKLTDPRRLLELRAAIVLIKHFTHLLPASPNPEAALVHFGELLENLFAQPDWIDALAPLHESNVLSALARLLGVSDFLWEDFLKLQHANLFPVITNLQALQSPKTREQMAAELSREFDRDTDHQVLVDVLNSYKDREMLRVDMRHILGLQDKFGMFSHELTDIAEVVVSAAVDLCYAEQVARHGRPFSPGGEPSRLAVCALGKCGGQELGFASDIELMFVYEHDGHTAGGGPGTSTITNVEFFQHLIECFRKAIHAKKKGIFEVDLRLRPYGQAGSLAVSQETFARYFGVDGPAWPYERQALVKLRPIAGDLHFGAQVAAVRDRILYTGRPFDVASMRAMREKQIRQLVKAGTFNVKLSPGGLVDCEYLVQGLQITHGHRDPSLRDPNTREALKALTRLEVMTETERVRLRDAYRFLRRVIDGLRMVRGDARDLTVPPPESEEFLFLARRLGYGADLARFRHDLESHTANVRDLSRLLDVSRAGDLPADPSATH